MGTVVSAVGVWLSLVLDLPTGATNVCTFGIVLALMSALRPLMLRRTIHNSTFKMQTVPECATPG